MRTLIACTVAGLVALGGLYAATAASAQASKLFVVGQRYGLLYSCIAQVGCFGELATIREVRSDGWLVITTDDGKRWTVNTANVIAFTVDVQRAQEP